MSVPSEGRVTTDSQGHVLLIGLDRVPKMNAFDEPMLRGLVAACTEFEQDDRWRCGVIYAHGPHFSSGLDLAAIAPLVAQGGRYVEEGQIDPWSVHGRRRTKPLVTALQGRCISVGLELALAGDVSVAAEDSRFAQLEVRRGLFPFGGATLRMVRACGWGDAMRWMLTGEEFGAAEALRIGLVQEVVPTGRQLERAMAIAGMIAAQAPLGVRAALASAWQSIEEGPSRAAEELLPEIRRLLQTDDAREGLASFVERREGRFSGR